MKEMTIDEGKHLYFLSGLEYDENELVNFIPQFNKALTLFNEIEECDTENVEKVYSVHLISDLREDVAKESLTVEEVLKNSPKSKRGCFAVPLMMEE